MTKNKRRIAKNEFRYNENQHHMSYVFEDDGKKYTSVGITSKEFTFDKKNMPLSKNPQKTMYAKPAYIRNGIIRDKHNSYSRVKRNFEFADEDFPKVKSKIRNYKKTRKKNK